MRSLPFLFAFQSVAARLLHSLPEDTYAFPKYRVTFLNGLPVLNETAQRWLRDGLRGGELEFLDQPWKEDDRWYTPSFKEIGDGDDQNQILSQPVSSRSKLEHMRLGPRMSYLCLIPSPIDTPSQVQDESHVDITPVHSWSLLQPLSGSCLYHRQGWFTYSYCHNQEIRQFRELSPSHPPAGAYHPEEDPDWESYTLGRAPPTPEPGADLTVAEQSAIAANFELGRGAGSRYLVQRWGDGTICDKTGRKREVEVQFHCSMTMTDTIIFVKETKTCSYVLVIHTPRLCGEPGFKSRLESREEAFIRCREIVDTTTNAHADQGALPESDHPVRLPWQKPKPVLPQPSADAPAKGRVQMDSLRHAIEALIGEKGFQIPEGESAQVFEIGEDGEFVIEFDVAEFPSDEGDDEERSEEIQRALVAAGFEITGEKPSDKKKGSKKAKDEKADGEPRHDRDEL